MVRLAWPCVITKSKMLPCWQVASLTRWMCSKLQRFGIISFIDMNIYFSIHDKSTLSSDTKRDQLWEVMKKHCWISWWLIYCYNEHWKTCFELERKAFIQVSVVSYKLCTAIPPPFLFCLTSLYRCCSTSKAFLPHPNQKKNSHHNVQCSNYQTINQRGFSANGLTLKGTHFSEMTETGTRWSVITTICLMLTCRQGQHAVCVITRGHLMMYVAIFVS